MPTLYNVGSLNIDWVYRVPHITRPGETLTSGSRHRHPGGKGVNQSVAAARAGQRVEHVGRVGEDGRWLRQLLLAEGVGVDHLAVDPHTPTGHAVIQVDKNGENAIFLFPGANHCISDTQLEHAMQCASPGDWVLTQNETGNAAAVLAAASHQGLKIAVNPAPMDDAARGLPLQDIDLLVINEQEAADLLGPVPAGGAAAALGQQVRGLVVVTRGAAGATAHDGRQGFAVPPAPVEEVVDTTGAGDAFMGALIAACMAGLPTEQALRRAAAAGAAAVKIAGAFATATPGDGRPLG